MKVSIISSENSLYDAEAWSVSLPGMKAPFTVLPGHAPIVSVLTAGKVSVQADKNSDEALSFDIKGGFAEIHADKVTICVEEQKQ